MVIKISNLIKVLAGIGSLLVFAASALGDPQGNKKATPPYAYVLVADEATLSKAGDNAYDLVIEKEDIEHVLEIGESPFELKNYISKPNIEKGWKPGSGKFDSDDLMQGTVMSSEGSINLISITAIAKDGKTMRISFLVNGDDTVDSTMLGELGDVTVFNYCCHTGYGNGEWLWGS